MKPEPEQEQGKPEIREPGRGKSEITSTGTKLNQASSKQPPPSCWVWALHWASGNETTAIIGRQKQNPTQCIQNQNPPIQDQNQLSHPLGPWAVLLLVSWLLLNPPSL